MHEERRPGVSQEGFEFALAQIKDGFVFERFAQQFLAAVVGHDLQPAGQIRDRGIDALRHTFERAGGVTRAIYQISIEQNPADKIEATLDALAKNAVDYHALYFVTNQLVRNVDVLTDRMFEKYGKPLFVYDIRWLSSRYNHSEATIAAFHTFVDSHLHEFSKPGKSYEVANLVGDPRLYVFLRQELDDPGQRDTHEKVADALIIYSLEDTDPDAGKFKSASEIKTTIGQLIKFDLKLLESTIDRRLKVLTQKPRRVHFHPASKTYCLPFETRRLIQERNLDDAALHHTFMASVETDLKKNLDESTVRVADARSLIESALQSIYCQQGLEFAEFVLNKQHPEALEKYLPDVVAQVVDNSSVMAKNREKVKSGLLATIRHVVYSGTEEQRLFLRRLSSTYMSLFLLRCDPKIAKYFEALSSKLELYVCTSIIIPALSEYSLAPEHRRHWNLLVAAHKAGVRLVVNRTIMNELVSHFRMIRKQYDEDFAPDEALYENDETMAMFIGPILIRAYYYAKRRGLASSFDDYLDNMTDPSLSNVEEDLSTFLQSEFGIKHVNERTAGIRIDIREEQRLFEELRKDKENDRRARTDAHLILTIYAIRESRNEGNDGSIFGYRTWWLSKDSVTHRAVQRVFKDKYQISCYLRPDFLYNYIAITPKSGEVEETFATLFPTMMGVNVGFHVSKDILDAVHAAIVEHRGKSEARISAKLRNLAERLKTDATARNRQFVKHYLDDVRDELRAENAPD